MLLSEKMAAADQRPAGFDYLRLILASSVILNHAFIMTQSGVHAIAMWAGPDRALIGLIVPAFFVLSGFLVTGSLERSRTLFSFLMFRVVRILPALVVDISFSALVIGPLFTTLPLSGYFHAVEFRSYFLNILGDIHYHLPGLFLTNPNDSSVNRQLWTIPLELKSYLALALLAVLGIASRRRYLLIALIVMQFALVARILFLHPVASIYPTGEVVLGTFLSGVCFFKYRDALPHRATWFVVAAGATLLLVMTPFGYDFLFVPLGYAVVYLGLLAPKRSWIISSGDYSYGLYLYGLPIQQALCTFGGLALNPWINILVAYPLAFVLAFTSWRLVEKPCNRFKPRLLRFETSMLRSRAIAWHSRRVLEPRGS